MAWGYDSQKTTHMPEGSFLPGGKKRSDREADVIVFGNHIAPRVKTETPFVNRDPERRINPSAVMPSAKSVIVIGVRGYAAPAPPDTEPRGRVAAIAVGEDYHKTAKALLLELVERLGDSNEYRIFADAGHLDERALAVRAGLGFIGKNGMVISKKFGSSFHIGYMLTDARQGDGSSVLQKRKIEEPSPCLACGDCRRCVDACPGGALGDAGFNYRKCVSYLTQKKKPPTAEEAAVMGKWLYGCDICRDVCPFNTHAERCAAEEAYPLLADCVNITDEEFDRRYGNSALHWRGAEIFRRNAFIAMNNWQN